MPGDSSYYPPVQYSPLWALLAVAIFGLIIAWVIVVLVRTRRRPAAAEADPLAGFPPPLPELRQASLARIDRVVTDHAIGVLDFHRAHQQLSLIVREFAGSARGIRAPYMTLEELRATPLVPLSTTVGELYPGAFSGTDSGSLDTAAERARRLVREWQ